MKIENKPKGKKPDFTPGAQPKSWDFGDPEEVKEALERNKRLVQEGFDIRKADENEPKPILDSFFDTEYKSQDNPESSTFKKGDSYRDRYWAMFNIVKDLVEEIKFLKDKLNINKEDIK